MNFRSLCMPVRHAPASLLILALSLPPGLLAGTAQARPHAQPDAAQAQQALQGLAVPFEANGGQFDERVAFVGKTFAGAVYVTRQGQIVYSLPAPKEEGWSLTETLVDAQALKPYGGEQAQTKISRFTGPKGYQAATYHNVQLGQAWPGIEVELAARGSNVEKLFHVKPHADAGRIQVRLAGAQSLRVGETGELIAKTGHGDVAYTAPVAFQQVDGKRIDVPVKYALNEAGDGYGFALGMYDRTQPLVIDPLLQSTYLGGRGDDTIRSLIIDAATGDVVVGGYTSSLNFPGTTGGALPSSNGSNDVFVARLSGDLKTLRQSTYLGGNGNEYIYALALDATRGDVVVGGWTESSDFPGTAGGAQPVRNGSGDGFVARLSGDLQTLRQSTYLGGSSDGGERVSALTLDVATGDVLVGGATSSTDFPGTAGGAQSARGASWDDGFITRLSGDLKVLRQSTYLGGADSDGINGLAMDTATGDVLASGSTDSSDFPGMSGGAQPGSGGGKDGFVARLSGDLKTLRQSTYLGGSAFDSADALAIDAATGDVLVGGLTTSKDFPGSAGGAQPAHAGFFISSFVARLSSDLKTLRQSTYLGGSGAVTVVNALVVDAASGDVVVAGNTDATDLPGTAGGAQPTHADGFITRLSGDLGTFRQSTYLGGRTNALAVDAATGDVLVAGQTGGGIPGTADGAQSASGGWEDGFLTRLTGDLKAISPQAITFPQQAEQEFVAGGSFNIDPTAKASSGLPVSYASSTPGVCTVAGDVVTMVSAGICTVVASQDGNVQWEPAVNVAQDIAIKPPPAAQTITFPAQADHDFVAGGSFAIDPAATASSGLPVSYASSTPGVCTVAGNVVTMVSEGTCTLVASQGGDAQWEPAANVAVSLVLVDSSGQVNPNPPMPPVPGQVTPVPVLGPFGLVLMSLLAGGLGWTRLRRRA